MGKVSGKAFCLPANCNNQQRCCEECDDCHDKDKNPCVVCPPGPQGPRGPIGPQGPIGEKGPIGPQGLPGGVELSAALTITPLAGGTRPVSAHLMITQIDSAFISKPVA